jgi:predicted nucleic-acid-binding protein
LIGIDTNVLVRYLMQDHAEQSELANQFFQKKLSQSCQGFISLVVLVEACWVLQSSYNVNDAELITLVKNLLSTPQLELEKRDCVSQSLQAIANSCSAIAELVDFIINAIALSEGCEYCVAFDKKAARGNGMKVLVPALLNA